MQILRVLLTAFDAFDSADVNPSEQAVQLLQQRLGETPVPPSDDGEFRLPDAVNIQTEVLVTCCDDAWQKLDRAAQAIPQDESFAIVMAGLAGNRTRICLERFALNVRSYRVDDNNGHRWQEEYIDKNAPDALRCRLPLFDLCDHLNRNGLMADISNYAGSFVCNETYFRAMQKWGSSSRCQGIIFIHVPNPIDYVGTNPDAEVPQTVERAQAISERAIMEYARSLMEVVKFISMKATARLA